MRRLILLVALFAVLPAPAAHARTSLVEVQRTGPLTVSTLERLGFDVTHDITAERVRLLLHSDAERERLAQAGYPARVVVADVEAATREARALDAKRLLARAPTDLPSGRLVYRDLGDYYSELDALAAAHPGVVKRVSLPRTSVEGRELPGVEIATNVNVDDGRPVYVVMGLHHAREWPSGEVSMEFAHDLAQNAGAHGRIKDLLDKVRVFVFPIINPDGFVVSKGDPSNATPATKALQRKNCQYDASGPSEPCALRESVDLNRNYGAYWGGNGASTQPSNDTYRGLSPWSEPEARAVWEWSRGRHITNFQSIHNIAALVLRPPGFKALGLAPDEPRLKELGDAMGAATGYSSEYGYQLYEVTGATEDWNYVAQNAFGYTIELGPGEASPIFQGPYQSHVTEQYLGPLMMPHDGDGVQEALLLAGEQAADARDHSVLHGSAPPGHTLKLTKTFQTATSELCQSPYNGGSSDCPVKGGAMLLDDSLETQLPVPAGGTYEWHVNPSTRPFVRKAGGTERWTLTCLDPGGQVVARRLIILRIGQRRALDACVPGPDDPLPTSATAPPADPPVQGGAASTPSAGSRLGLSVGVTSPQRLSTVLRRGLLVRARCIAACTLTSSVRRSSRDRTRALGRRSLALRPGRTVSFRVRLSAQARRELRRGRSRVLVRVTGSAGRDHRVVARGVRIVRR